MLGGSDVTDFDNSEIASPVTRPQRVRRSPDLDEQGPGAVRAGWGGRAPKRLRGEKRAPTLRVQSTQMWSIYGVCIRNRNSDFWNVLCIWVLGPLGLRLGHEAVFWEFQHPVASVITCDTGLLEDKTILKKGFGSIYLIAITKVCGIWHHSCIVHDS